MERLIFDGVACAYCPKLDDEWRIDLRLVEVVTIGGKACKWTHFNCLEQFTCEEFDRLNGCSFIREVAERFE